MNPTTLNLLALSVFAFTLLSLVGPLLNISPAAVAIALTGGAGVFALDRFSWQGKGANLLVDLFSGQNSEYRQRILHHEAGHFLAAHLLDIPVQSYTLSAWQGIKAGLPGLGGVVIDMGSSEKSEAPEAPEAPDKANASDKSEKAKDAEKSKTIEPEQQLNRFCIVWMAGIAAETQTYGNAQGGDDDQAQLRRLWQQVTPSKAEADTQLRWALLQANALITNQSNAYEALVKAMANQETVAACCEQIEAHLQPSD